MKFRRRRTIDTDQEQVVISGARWRDTMEALKARDIEIDDLHSQVVRLSRHSATLNALGYDMAEFLGRPKGEDGSHYSDPEIDLDEIVARLVEAEKSLESLRGMRDDGDPSPVLIDALTLLGKQYGPLGVALVAARMTDTPALIQRLTEPSEDAEPRERRPFEFDFGDDGPSLESAVYQALGAASMAWTSTPTGIFDDTWAAEVGAALIEMVGSDMGRLYDALYQAWTVLANVSGGDWTQQPEEWQAAVVRWRDEVWHPLLAAQDALGARPRAEVAE